MQKELNQYQQLSTPTTISVQIECYLIQLIHLSNVLIDGIKNEQETMSGGRNATIPMNIAMKAYM